MPEANEVAVAIVVIVIIYAVLAWRAELCLPGCVCVWGFPGGTSGKEPACQCRRCKRCGFDPWVGKIPWSRKWQPTLVFLPGKSRGPRGLIGYSPWGHRGSDTTERLSTHIAWEA